MKVRTSKSVHLFGDKIHKIWKLEEWEGIDDLDKDVLFFGMYAKEDYDVFWAFEGTKTIFWCGMDIIRMFQVLERMRVAKEDPDIEHWVETVRQASELAKVGIRAHIAPSFLENVNDFFLSFKPTDKPHIYLSGHPDREDEYGFGLAKRMAERFPGYTFHLYGVDKKDDRNDCPKNVIYHGWVSNKQFNKEIKNYQASMRPNQHDGNSEIPMKAMLMGQYAITWLPYRHAWQFRNEEELVELLQRLRETKKPNTEAREYWRKNLNQYPWIPGSKCEDIYDVQGSKMYLNTQEPNFVLLETFRAYLQNRFHERATTELFKKTVQKGDTVIDLGANLGYFSLLGARLAGKEGKIYAFEPEPKNYQYLLKNIELNNYNITAVQKAIADENGKAKFYICPYDSGHHTLNQYEGISSYRPVSPYAQKEFVEVEVIKLDDLISEKVDVIKMDVEGSEMLALMGMDGIIKRSENLKMFVEFFPLLIKKMGNSPKEFIKKLLDYRFSIFIVPNDYGVVNEELLQIHSFEELMKSCPHEKSHLNLFLKK